MIPEILRVAEPRKVLTELIVVVEHGEHYQIRFATQEIVQLRLRKMSDTAGARKLHMNYFFIPIETQAYDMQARYITDPQSCFSVKEEIKKTLSGVSL